jgi:hypothetical protein
LTIEQIESQRKQKIKDEQKAAESKAELAAKNSNLAKFLVNVESRIYAQLSKQLADEMFAEGGGIGHWINYDKNNLINTKNGMIVSKDANLKNINPKDVKGFDILGKKYSDGGSIANQQLINDATTNTANMFASEGIYNKGGALKTERRYVNHSQDYETRYARKHTSRHGYGNVKYDGGGQLSQYGKFISSQIEHLISLKTIAAKKEPIQNLLKNMDDYRGTEIEKRITTDNLKYALQQKTVSKMNEVLRISLNALKD